MDTGDTVHLLRQSADRGHRSNGIPTPNLFVECREFEAGSDKASNVIQIVNCRAVDPRSGSNFFSVDYR